MNGALGTVDDASSREMTLSRVIHHISLPLDPGDDSKLRRKISMVGFTLLRS
eukprot:CAMPEP_0201886676 /NCGR_PEP_ID=MMETSP0902-20130614/22787_1 /ASSEMBLY_ACC=CAM_ASM_000551 /TAXON_ID=420261 /ORGANISM="Thalassiosira antarctica, Strain CCMP982" /LENGTH=51 /DNA_ID=CAMNT_0048416321 /DNA_START=80 /DNA_END=235 /DNA_ORIENTATION=-